MSVHLRFYSVLLGSRRDSLCVNDRIASADFANELLNMARWRRPGECWRSV